MSSVSCKVLRLPEVAHMDSLRVESAAKGGAGEKRSRVGDRVVIAAAVALLKMRQAQIGPVCEKSEVTKYEPAEVSLSDPLGYTEGVQYLFPQAKSKLMLCEKAKAELAVHNMPHIEASEKHKEAYEALAVTCQSIDVTTGGLLYWKEYLKHYETVMASPCAIPSCLHLASIEELRGEFGLFATENIAANTFLGCYTGKFVEQAEVKDFRYMINLNELYCIDPTEKGSYARYINHSKDNRNVGIKLLCNNTEDGHVQLIAALYTIRSVDQGEQLLFDYDSDYDWSHVPGGKPFEITPRTYMLDLSSGEVVSTSHRPRRPRYHED